MAALVYTVRQCRRLGWGSCLESQPTRLWGSQLLLPVPGNPAEQSSAAKALPATYKYGLVSLKGLSSSQIPALLSLWLESGGPSTVCQESLNATPEVCTQVTDRGGFWNKLGTAPPSSFHSQLQSEAIRGDSLSPMSTSPPCHSPLYPEIYNHSVTAAMHSHVPFQVLAAGRHCSPVLRKVLAMRQGGHHCCSLVRKGQGFWEATHAHSIESGHNDATTVILDKAWDADHHASDCDRAERDGGSLQPGKP